MEFSCPKLKKKNIFLVFGEIEISSLKIFIKTISYS